MKIRNLFHNEDDPFSRFLLLADDDGSGDDGGGGSGGDAGDSGDDGNEGGGDDGGNADEGGKGSAGDEGGKGSGDEAGQGLMANADALDDVGEDSGHTIEHDKETLKVPEKFWDKDGKKLNEGAVLKAALDAGKNVRTLQNELAEAKKGVGSGMDKDTPEDAAGYLADGDADDAMVKDGHLQLKDGAKNLKPVPVDDPVVKLFAEVAKEEGFSKERFERIVGKVLAGVDDAVPTIDLEAEAEKFGPNAKAVAVTNKTWADNMLKAGAISEAERVHLLNMGMSAVGLSVVNKIRIMTGGKNIPVNEGGVEGELPSKEEWYAAKPDARTEPDAYTKWQKQGEQIFGTAPAGSSESGIGVPKSQGGQRSAYENKDEGRRGRRSRT